jgi:predicted transcriptional regulator
MEVHFTPEQQERLHDEIRFLAAVDKGLAAARRGEFIEEEEMDVRLEAIFRCRSIHDIA